MKVVFMGTPEFAEVILRELVERHEVVAVVTQTDKPVGRKGVLTPPPVKVLALELGIPVLQPKALKTAAFAERLRAFGAELGVVAAYGRILPKAALGAFPLGCLNVHGSLLPKYRGASPIQTAIVNGERETGVTIMQMDEGLDTGDILAQASVTIEDGDTGGSLFEKLAALGAGLLVDTIDKLGDITPVPQDGRLATHSRVLNKEDGLIDWSSPSRLVVCKVNGLNPWPGAYTVFDGRPLKVWRAEAADGSGAAGEVLAAGRKGGLVVACGAGAVSLLEVQAVGGKRLAAADYINGNREGITCGMILG